MKHLLKSIVVAGALAFAGHQAHAERFYVSFSGLGFAPDPDQGNKLVSARETTASLLGDAAADFSIELKNLALVFDTVADQIQIVKKSDGTVVDVEFELRGGNTVTSPDGKVQYRQAFLYQVGENKPYGSVFGRIDRKFDPANPSVLVAFRWVAIFQHSTAQAAVDEPAEAVSGRFTTGKLFVLTP